MPTRISIPKPPGGQLSCSDDQLAIVEIRNGEVFAECHSQPDSVVGATQLQRQIAINNWALSLITGKERSANQELSSYEREVLKTERYQYVDDRGTVVIVWFRLPSRSTLGGGEGSSSSFFG